MASLRNEFITLIPRAPQPIKPTVMRLLGAGFPAWPSADAGMIVGAATVAKAPVFRNCRRSSCWLFFMSKNVGVQLSLPFDAFSICLLKAVAFDYFGDQCAEPELVVFRSVYDSIDGQRVGGREFAGECKA